jgi:hypothetical protein
MLNYVNKKENKEYTFIINSKWIDYAVKGEKTFENDVYKKYNSTINILYGELIECNDLLKTDTFCKKLVYETYEDYKEFITKRDFKKEQWIYNIIDGIAEHDKILYNDDKIVIIPNYTWTNDSDLSKMYILTIPTDKTLHSLRDLNENHIELLEYIKIKTLEIIKNTYGFDSDIVKCYIHYAPSTYHLHIHFCLITNIETNSSVEYSHSLTNVITNIKIKNNYYQTVILEKRI